jgi:hypothetical protein
VGEESLIMPGAAHIQQTEMFESLAHASPRMSHPLGAEIMSFTRLRISLQRFAQHDRAILSF